MTAITTSQRTFVPHLNRWTALVSVLICLVYNHYFVFQSEIQIDIEVDTYEISDLRVYWADKAEGFSEKKSRRVSLGRGRLTYQFLIDGLDNIERLRIDPLELRWRKDPRVEIKLNRLTISQTGYATLDFQGEHDLTQLQPVNGLENVEFLDDGLSMRTTNNDSQLLLALTPDKTSFFPPVHLFNYLLIFLVVGLLRASFSVLKDNLSFVPVLLFATFPLVLAMAYLSAFNTHPDEFVHLFAIEFYSKNWFPPAMDSAEIAHTFSDYGQTRLASLEIYYQIAGVVTRLLQPLNMEFFYDARSFSVFLFAVVLYLSTCYKAFRYFALPLLISPQIWYLFSYANSDSFALIISMFLVYQAAYEKSALNRFLQQPKPPAYVLSVVVFGSLIGLILLLKSNFYIMGVFLFLYLIWRICCGDFPERKRLATRLLLLALVAITVFGARWGIDRAVNGFDRGEKFHQLQAEHAQPQFNPGTPLEDQDVYLHLKAKGLSLDFLIQFLKWDEVQFATSFGSYGYTQYNGSDLYYTITRNLVILLLLSIVIVVLLYGTKQHHALLALVFICASILMLLSFLSSWMVNFQPQGRYMIPILPMTSVLLYHARQYILTGWIVMLVAALWALSVYSFLFVGLKNIPKVAGISF